MINYQILRKNDINPDSGKQVEFGRSFISAFEWGDDTTHPITIHIGKDTIYTTLKVRGTERGGARSGADCKEYANESRKFPLKEYLIAHYSQKDVGKVFMIFESIGSRGEEFNLYFTPRMADNGELLGGCNSNTDLPLQVIYYGAPGTSKSTTIKRKTKDKEVHRITFHPDTDYSNFVGCYKPTKPEGSTQITYEFVAQTFTKAYVSAWRKMDGKTTIQTPIAKRALKIADNGGSVFTIVAVEDDVIRTTKDMVFAKEAIEAAWNIAWEKGTFIPEGKWQTRIEWAVCKWITENVADCNAASYEDGWDKLLKTLQENESITVGLNENGKQYEISYESDDAVHVFSPAGGNKKKTIQKNYDATNITPTSAASCLQLLLKERDAVDFDNAWKILQEEFNTPAIHAKTEPETTSKEVYLVIEEINRGNCAQIFGDIFQLLDRDDSGYSDYSIEPDTDLQAYIKKEFADTDLPEGIKSGKIMQLPPNLYIRATMNTSDQSLFPIDSAFKRRWDWKYLPITDAKKNHKIRIDVNGSTFRYDWWKFLEVINGRIESLTESEDKQLGYWFAHPKNGTDIDIETLVGKVLFYLWNDIFKDFGEDERSPFMFKSKADSEKKEKVTFRRFFNADGTIMAELVKRFLDSLLQAETSTSEEASNEDPPVAATAEESPTENDFVEEPVEEQSIVDGPHVQAPQVSNITTPAINEPEKTDVDLF